MGLMLKNMWIGNEIHGMDSSVTGKSRGIRHRALDLLYGAKSKVSRDDAAVL